MQLSHQPRTKRALCGQTELLVGSAPRAYTTQCLLMVHLLSVEVGVCLSVLESFDRRFAFSDASYDGLHKLHA